MKVKMLFLLFFYLVSVQLSAMKDTLHVSFQSEKYRLGGKILAPKDRSSKMPAIIFLVGSGGNSSYSTNYADFLQFFLEKSFSNEKIALMYFDKRGVGKSEGSWYNADFEQRALDVKNASEYLKKLSFIDADQVFLVGHSQGGWIVQVCLAKYPENFAGGISMAGATFGVKKQLINDYQSAYICFKNLANQQAYKKAQSNVNRVLAFTTVFPFKKNWKQLRRIKKFEPAYYLDKIEKPILFMWGENDKLVSHQWCMEELANIFPAGIPPNFQTYVAKGENHSFKRTSFCYSGRSKDTFYSEDSRERLVSWLQSNLKKQ